MKTRLFLFLANLLGVLVLTSIVTVQWVREKILRDELVSQVTQLNDTRGKWLEAENRVTSLEADITQLKEAVETTSQARTEAEQQLIQFTAERDTQTTAAKDKITAWEKALAERDTRIRSLSETLSATRKRLDEAVAKLKAAAR